MTDGVIKEALEVLGYACGFAHGEGFEEGTPALAIISAHIQRLEAEKVWMWESMHGCPTCNHRAVTGNCYGSSDPEKSCNLMRLDTALQAAREAVSR